MTADRGTENDSRYKRMLNMGYGTPKMYFRREDEITGGTKRNDQWEIKWEGMILRRRGGY